VEFKSGQGRICFVPVPIQGTPPGQLGTAVVKTVEEHFGGFDELDMPEWAKDVSIPGVEENNVQIAGLEARRNEIDAELSRFKVDRDELINYRVLLFGTGQAILEPVVRQALRCLGFTIPEPEEYEGEWDVDLSDPASGNSAIAEVEGSEGAINIDKLRQLLDYVEAEEDAGRKRKGILIGNGYRLTNPNDPIRNSQFTEKALARAQGFGYSLLPTSELFKAVCAILADSENEAYKARIRSSILSQVGVWHFEIVKL
jgi:hypothetical protein